MLFICPICGERWEHHHSSEVGSTVQMCKTLPGSIWVRVISDERVGIDNIPVTLTGKEILTGDTKGGFAGFDNLAADTYIVKLGIIPEQYEPQKVVEKSVATEKGSTKVVTFKLQRRAQLKVRLVVKSGANLVNETPLEWIDVPVKAEYTGDGVQPKTDNRTAKGGTADFGLVSAGKYELTPTLSGLSLDDYDYVEDPKTVDLKPGDKDKEVVFEVVRKAKLTAKFVLKKCGSNFPDDLPFKITPIPVRAEPHPSAKGSTDNRLTTEDQAVLKLTPSSYTVTPTFTGLDNKLFEWKDEQRDVQVADDNDPPVVFNIGRKAKLRVEIVYKHDHDHRLRDSEREIVPIKLEFHGNEFKPAETLPDVDTKDGIAEVTSISPGMYTITPDFSKLDTCRFDYNPLDKRDVEIVAGVDDPVIFEVEPLYQEVEFIAHCLLTIPTQIFEPSPQDLSDALAVSEDKGVRTFTFKKKKVVTGKYGRLDVAPFLDGAKAEMKPGLGQTKLVMKKNPSQSFFTPDELGRDFLDRIKLGNKLADDPLTYAMQYADKTEEQDCTVQDLTGTWKAKYHGHKIDRDDIIARVKFLQDTIEKAFAKAKPHPTILKVFLIPECFFQGLHGVYLKADADYLIEQLQKAVGDKKWKDWVFSFGTINSVTEAPPVSGIIFTREIYEMKNQAPVIRGGLGSQTGKPSTRLVPKLLNSAELADVLIEDPNKQRKQAINEDVQFAATESENMAGALLADLLREEKEDGSPGKYFIQQHLPADLWRAHGLIEELELYLARWGMTRVIREIRSAANNLSDRPLPDWTFCSYASSMREPQTALPTLDDAVSLLIQKKWEQMYPAVPLAKKVWTDASGNRQAVLGAIAGDCENFATSCGFSLTIQKTALKVKIDELFNDDLVAQQYNPSLGKALIFRPSIFPIWKKVLSLYKKKKASGAPLDLDKKALSLDDYCMVGPRKVGPWIDSVNDGLSLESCKRMVFGLEICADHADQRLNLINPDVIGIDIQLVPSAGMSLKKYATKKGGFLFNCDGWNQKPNGGRFLEIPLDGPNPFVIQRTKFDEFGFSTGTKTDEAVSPVYPHSALGCCPANGRPEVGTCEVPEDHAKPDTGLAELIFGYGPGELHFYKVQALPR